MTKRKSRRGKGKGRKRVEQKHMPKADGVTNGEENGQKGLH